MKTNALQNCSLASNPSTESKSKVEFLKSESLNRTWMVL